MSMRTIKVTQKAFERAGACLLGTAAFMLSLATPGDAKPGFHPVIIRGTGTQELAELQLAYQATFPNGSLDSSVDHLGAGPMEVGDTLIPESNPTFVPLPGEIQIRDYAAGRPVARPHRRPERICDEDQFRSGNGLAHEDHVQGPDRTNSRRRICDWNCRQGRRKG